MEIIVILLILGAGILLLVLAAGLFLPATWIIEKAELIAAPTRDIYPLLYNLREWGNWTIWTAEGGALEFEYKGNEVGAGAVQEWQSKRINGTLQITRVVENQEIDYVFRIKESNLVLKGTIVLAAADTNYTQVAWRVELEKLAANSPVRRFQAVFIRNYFERAIEESLLSLQSMYAK